MSFTYSVLSFVLALQLIGFGFNRLVRAVDLIDGKSNDDILGIICDDSPSSRGNQQIARISTVKRLEEFMSKLESGHKYHKCAEDNLESVRLLKDVVSNSNTNVCSDEKIGLIERYHYYFVATGGEFEKSRQEHNRRIGLPKLNIFFQNYAMAVSAVCQTSLINNVEWHLQEVFGEDVNEQLVDFSGQVKELSSGALGVIFEGIIGKFMQLFTVEKYDDALLIWDLVKGNAMRANPEAFSQQDSALDPVTGEPIKLRLKSRVSNNFNLLKGHCHFKLKPIYAKLILPLIRLSNMGYANKGEQFKIELNELKTNDKVKRWYAVTQICEAILPIMSYEDVSMNFGDVVVLTPEEAKELDKQASVDGTSPSTTERQAPLSYEPDTNSMEHVDLLESIQSGDTVNQVKSNLGAINQTRRRMIKNLVKHVVHELKSRAGKLFFPKKTKKIEAEASSENKDDDKVGVDGDGQGRQDAKPELVYTIEQLTDEDLADMSDESSPLTGSSNVVTRAKRRHRKGDFESMTQERRQAIAVKRTMTIGEIFAPCVEFWKLFQPSWLQLILGGVVVLGLMILFLFAAILISHG